MGMQILRQGHFFLEKYLIILQLNVEIIVFLPRLHIKTTFNVLTKTLVLNMEKWVKVFIFGTIKVIHCNTSI